MSLTDSHCHLDHERFDRDREQVIERALEAGIKRVLSIGTGNGPPDLEAGIRLVERYSELVCTVGVHPHYAGKATAATFDELAALITHPKVVAIGEMGLDSHYDFAPVEKQREVFIEQMRLARGVNKPIVIHTREAWDDTMRLIGEHWEAAAGGIMHCFSEGPAEAQQAMELGFFISFAGIVTFSKAAAVQAAAREVPLDRLLVETDAPYLAPAPLRGKRNEPAFVTHTARKVAELRGASFEEIAAATSANFGRLCKL